MKNNIRNILIVEDDELFCKMLTRYLVKQGFEVSDAQTASEAYDRLRSTQFDLAVLDYKLPDENGLEILKRIKNETSTTKVILMSRYSNDELEEEAKQEGADGFASKPIDPAKLLEIILGLN
jgi:DNA-binding response OmpR family regulator